MRRIKVIILLVLVCLMTSFFHTGTALALSSSEFYLWLDNSGIPEYSISGSYRANYGTYVKYNLIVYGNPGDVPQNEMRQGEYRYLGFTYLEGRYTNLEFPNDVTGNLPPEQWDYVTISGAVESWDSLEQIVQLPYMLHTSLSGHGATNLTAADIGTSKAKVQSAASWGSSGSIYTYKSNAFYATFTVPSMGGGFLSASLAPDSSIIYVDETDDRFDTGVNLSAAVNKPKNEVAFIKVVFSCGTWRKVRFFHNTNSISIHQDADLDLPANLPGSVIISAAVTSESIFGDKLSKNLSCAISIRKRTGNPTPHPPNTPNPTPFPTAAPTPTRTPGPSYTPSPTNTPDPSPGGDDNEDSIRVLNAQLTGSWNHWDRQPHRFLALEEVELKLWILGKADRAVIRMSPQLESMTYTNSSGYTYDYSDDFFGYEVKFPEDSTLSPKTAFKLFTTFEWNYSLPLCDETIRWDNSKISEPYVMQIIIFDKKGNSIEYIIDDIDITGNIYELLYPQPAD
ncbi:MAG: hypothetical protein J7L77_03305 [Clostridiales bacterium]|nr:hypothetical protein [Clostridiales bacterium]